MVIDTNGWLSGLIFGGNPGGLIKSFSEGTIIVAISEELISELRRKITEKFPLYLSQLQLLEASLRQDAEMVRLGSKTVSASRDVDDNKFIETALLSNCDFIISGDRHLLELKQYEGIKIVKPAALLKLIKDS